VEELLVVREACEQVVGELVHIEASLFGSQIEFGGLTRNLLTEIARRDNLLIDVDRTDVIEIIEAKNINIPVEAINENKLVLNYKHHLALSI
jgi:hypothetical protein